MTPRKIQINQIFYDGPETVFSVNADGTWTGDLQKAIDMIRADERAKVEREIADLKDLAERLQLAQARIYNTGYARAEREIAEWLVRRDGTDDPDEWQERKNLADAIVRGDYRKPQEGGE